MALNHRKYPLGEALIKVKWHSFTPSEMPPPFLDQRRAWGQRVAWKWKRGATRYKHEGPLSPGRPWRWCPFHTLLPTVLGGTGLPERGLEAVRSWFISLWRFGTTTSGSQPQDSHSHGGRKRLTDALGRLLQVVPSTWCLRDLTDTQWWQNTHTPPPCHPTLVAD